MSVKRRKTLSAIDQLVMKANVNEYARALSGDSKEALEQFGHPRFYKMCDDEKLLHSRKNHDYASGGDPLGNFKRVAVLMTIYKGVEWDTPYGNAIVQMLKQFDAVLWALARKTKLKVEGFYDRFRDISVYSKLIPIMLDDEAAMQDAIDREKAGDK